MIACKAFPKINFIGLIFVFERKESDCIIIEIPLKDIIEEINASEMGVMFTERSFAPLVISTMPDITL